MIVFENVSKIFKSCSNRPVIALSGISFQINQGEFVCLMGPSGAGKTTLIKLLIGEEKPTQGRVIFQDCEVPRLGLSALQKLRKKIGVVHQDYRLLFNKTVRENLAYIMQVIGASDQSIARDVPQVLAMVGLAERSANFPAQLSGGEQQRLALARAVIHRPELVIADEPTGNLDVGNTLEIINLLKKINRLGATILLSTHDQQVISRLASRKIILEKGKLLSH